MEDFVLQKEQMKVDRPNPNKGEFVPPDLNSHFQISYISLTKVSVIKKFPPVKLSFSTRISSCNIPEKSTTNSTSAPTNFASSGNK
ncbi:unnamed protein product [Dovyalis caffra]|uniref:Uncharacterized protein n=1 Tax=Dovyalis caffra TaxID=77055 RepID=A0AAV1SD45_9ROSI|nr:unnamed protein product [Dovyalis caffra]